MKLQSKLTILTIIVLIAIFPPAIFYAAGSNFQQVIYPLTECNDGIDNDADGGIDFATDPQCNAWTDPSESDTPMSSPISGPTTPANSNGNTNPLSPVYIQIGNIVQATVPLEVLEPAAGFVQDFLWAPFGSILGTEDLRTELDNPETIGQYTARTFIAMTIYLSILTVIGLMIISKSNANRNS